jgi:NADH-quinone oxidoreductase subunit G
MLESPRKAYVLLGVEPEFDCWDSATALAAIKAAEFVVSLTAYASNRIKEYADLILPIAAFAETSGTYVNAEGRWQSFQGAVKPLGEARPAWKVLRVLGNSFDLAGFDYLDSTEVLAEVRTQCEGIEPRNQVEISGDFKPLSVTGLLRVADVPIYAVDALARRAQALQQTPLARPAEVTLHPELARELGLAEAKQARVRQNGNEVILPLVLDEGIPKGCVWVSAGLAGSATLGPAIGAIEVGAA